MWKFFRTFVVCALILPVTALTLSETLITRRHYSPSHTAFAQVGSPHAARRDEGIPQLTPGKVIQQELSAGESHSYVVALDSGQYLRVLLDQWGTGVRMTVYGPDDRVLTESRNRLYEPAPLSVIAETSGTYRLEVRATGKGSATGHFKIIFEEVRRATAKDEHRIAAENAFAEGEHLRAEGKTESRREAIKKYEEALPSWRMAGDGSEEADTLRNIGEVYHQLGEPRVALEYFKRALLRNRKGNDRRGKGETLNSFGFTYLSLGENQKALEYLTRALALGRTVGNRRGEAQVLNNLGEVHYYAGNLQKALEVYHQALRIWWALDNRRGQAQTLTDLGYIYSDLSENQKALDSYNQAYALWSAMNDQRGQAVTLSATGKLYSRLGESQEALNLFSQARQLIRPMGDLIEEARLLNGTGYVYEELGERHEALNFYNQALLLYRAANFRGGEAATLHEIGRIHYSSGDNEKALDYFQQALAMSRALSDRRMESYALREIGMAYDAVGAKEKALDYYEQALSLNRSGKDRRGETDTLNLIGGVYRGRGEKLKALGYFNQSLPLGRAAGYRFGEASALYNIARVERDRDNLTEARAGIEAALKVAESLRTKVASQGLRASYFATVRQHYEFYIDVLMRLHKRRPSEGFDATALEISERARARSLLETLIESRADIRRGIDPALLERERALQQQLNAKAERQMQLRSGRHAAEDAAAIAKEIDEITGEYDAVKAQIRAASPHYAALTQPQPLSLEAIQRQVLDDNTLLLEYALGDERSYLWAVTRTGMTSYELPGGAEIEGAARRLYDLLTARQPVQGETFEQLQTRVREADARYWQEAEALSETLLGRVAGQLEGKKLLVVADGALQYIPFGALTVPGAAKQSVGAKRHGAVPLADAPLPLMINHEVINLPSASALAVLREETFGRKPAAKAVAVLADPVFEKDDPRIPSRSGGQPAASAGEGQTSELNRALRDVEMLAAQSGIPRLLASRAEAEAIIAVTPAGAGLKAVGFEADRSMATKPELGQYRVVHFATHGLLNSEHPELSGIILSLFDKRGQPQDGFLRLHDVYNLNLPVELVVLSACNTGLGKDVKGEGLIGLTRGFMYAGAKGVMASLWKVDDQATAELMKHFYRGMLKEGLSPAAALRKAQIAMWEQKRWHAPYFWAAFALQGEYKDSVSNGGGDQLSAGMSRIVGAGVIMLILFTGGLYAARRRRRNNHP